MKTRVLVVDDKDSCRAIAQLYLGDISEVLEADSVDEAIRKLESESVDLILTDINMPQREGFELVEYTMTRLPNTAIMMWSGSDDPAYKTRAGAYGVTLLQKDGSNVYDTLRNMVMSIPRRSLDGKVCGRGLVTA